jgi:hypothetical protein
MPTMDALTHQPIVQATPYISNTFQSFSKDSANKIIGTRVKLDLANPAFKLDTSLIKDELAQIGTNTQLVHNTGQSRIIVVMTKVM